VVRATAPSAVVFKPKAAFLEARGARGWADVKGLIREIPDGIPGWLDAKRGDIASAARAYARAAFEILDADALTLNPYLGLETLAPFADDPARGMFVLCKTSNPQAAMLQDLEVSTPHGPRTVYEHLAASAQAWRGGEIGLVVGATHPESMRRVREAAPDAWILAPGVGAQGGHLAEALGAGVRQDGLGLLISVSRGNSRATDPGQAAATLCEQIRAARAQVGPRRAVSDPLAQALVTSGCVRFGEFTLKSGRRSPVYIDLRRLIDDPALLRRACAAYLTKLSTLSYDRLAAIPYAGLPIGVGLSLLSGDPLIYPRREAKSYGTQVPIEGTFEQGERVLLIDDLISTGGSKLEAVEVLRGVGLEVTDVLVLIDRSGGQHAEMKAAGLTLHALYRFEDLIETWHQNGLITETQRAEVLAFLQPTLEST